ncbi:unnamed protein product [Pleuronectes platessa]|uniref:Transmembrane protein n=1 Tax=Pleuronectes platessa TaxID=8262 RepID=A0A9N7TID2_PLEPL|nr:unnamed protein product [Pleuronectes platessa]
MRTSTRNRTRSPVQLREETSRCLYAKFTILSEYSHMKPDRDDAVSPLKDVALLLPLLPLPLLLLLFPLLLLPLLLLLLSSSVCSVFCAASARSRRRNEEKRRVDVLRLFPRDVVSPEGSRGSSEEQRSAREEENPATEL